MIASKTEYILKSIKKISHKKWEFFIVTRIIHGLTDDIEFITQQLVRRPDGKRALTDLYFPQFNVHLEIDEPFHHKQKEEDFKREQDIVQITNHTVFRIKIANDNNEERALSDIRADVDEFINHIVSLKGELVADNKFIPWDFENRYSSDVVIRRGYVSIEDNVVFRTQVEAMRCFGFNGKGWQKGAWSIPDGSNDYIWFPRLYEHGIWHNELSADGLRIFEQALNNNEDAKLSIIKQKEDVSKHPNRKMIVFAKGRDALGFNLLRYVGTFMASLAESTDTALIFERVSDSEKVRECISDD